LKCKIKFNFLLGIELYNEILQLWISNLNDLYVPSFTDIEISTYMTSI